MNKHPSKLNTIKSNLGMMNKIASFTILTSVNIYSPASQRTKMIDKDTAKEWPSKNNNQNMSTIMKNRQLQNSSYCSIPS